MNEPRSHDRDDDAKRTLVRWRLGGFLALGVILILIGAVWMTMSNAPPTLTRQGSSQ